jgi:hypothetical protein
MFNRELLGLGFVILGLNGVYLGCIENGSDNRRNPVWGFLSGLIELEKLTLYGIGMVIGLFFLWKLREVIFDEINRRQKSKDEIISVHRNHSFRSVKPVIEMPKSIVPKAVPIYNEPEIDKVIAKLNLVQNHCEENLIPKKQNITAKELKEKALADLLRR